MKNNNLFDIQIFNSEEFGEIRTLGTPEEPLFCLADLCKPLGLQTSRVKDRLRHGVISTHPIIDNLGRQQIANFVNEDGLYDVILYSKKPQAKKFRMWITSEVLPTIRKHGAYITNETISKIITNPDFIIKLAIQLKQEQQKNLELTDNINYKDSIIEGLTEEIPLADMRQRITQIIRKRGRNGLKYGYKLLYDEFDKKYHININARMAHSNYPGTKIDYIELELQMLPELYDLACKIFESSYEALIESWGKTVHRARRKENIKSSNL